MQTSAKPVENSKKILEDLQTLLASELAAINACIQDELHSAVPLTQAVTKHIFQSGGKRLRPLLVVLSAKACDPTKNTIQAHHALATVIEFVHTATLLHDDVIDNSDLRRGKKTANAIWHNQASILVGDFLYSRAFQLLARQNKPDVMSVLAQTTNALAEGEVRQLMNQHDPDLTEENYFRVITDKTAQLFSAASEIGAILSDATAAQQKAMATYGLHIGMAFQIVDDLLDYQADQAKTGKNLGDDLAEGKATLPIIYALQASDEKQADFIRDTLKHGKVECFSQIQQILIDTNALEKTKAKAIEHTKLAAVTLSELPDSDYRSAMDDLLTFAVQRCY